ncbi:helix-turn-helix transcriptional regulator [Fulvivirgaceae bacterium BMA12]|uniref:Helix-turn-helix transcriptional regulator n=1 Tax=Agaribacillus aureus TaxID=3051825 RepID=A0ABT8L518_9BACT|nr:helix-turn-helix transcriptional regulator [Fulvivirgaceae bacterium BMA12]
MFFRQIPVRNELRTMIRSIIQIELDTPGMTFRNFPSSNLNLVFSYKDDAIEKTHDGESIAFRFSIEGFRNSPVEYIPLGKIGLVIVTLNPSSKSLIKELGGAFTLNNNWDLRDIYYSLTRNINEKLINANDADEAIKFVEYFLMKILLDASPNVYVEAAINYIQHNNGQIRVREISNKIGYSKKQLERMFIRHVGLTPKKYAQIIQFQHCLYLLQKPFVTMTGVAFEAGFFDQAHFIHTFRQFCGQSPLSFLNFISELKRKSNTSKKTYGSHYLIE